MTPLTDGELARFRAGDEVVFRRLVDEYSPRLLAFLRRFATDLDDAHDLLQEMWHRAYEKREAFRGSGTLLGWLYAICRSMGLAAADKRLARERTGIDPDGHLGSAAPDPVAAVEHAELHRHLHEALLELPDREREVVVLRMLEHKSTRETAIAMQCAEGTVKAALHHALAKLQSSMEVWVR